jgi:hypothetical protein
MDEFINLNSKLIANALSDNPDTVRLMRLLNRKTRQEDIWRFKHHISSQCNYNPSLTEIEKYLSQNIFEIAVFKIETAENYSTISARCMVFDRSDDSYVLSTLCFII